MCQMAATEYALQYQFASSGNWYTDDHNYTELHLAQATLRKIEKANKVCEGYPRRWRIVKREVTEWEEVK